MTHDLSIDNNSPPKRDARTVCEGYLNALAKGDTVVALAQGPLFVCHVIPLETVGFRHAGFLHETLSPAIIALQSARPGGYHLRSSRNNKYAALVCKSEQHDNEQGLHAYAHLTRYGQIELVTTASSFAEILANTFIIRSANGYEQPLKDHGLHAVQATLRQLQLEGPLLVSLTLLRLEDVAIETQQPGTGIRVQEAAPTTPIQELLDLDSIDALSISTIREPLDRLREKLGLAPAGKGAP